MRTKEEQMQLAGEILSQLGGHHFKVCVGAKNIYALENGLQLDFMRNVSKATRLRVLLDVNDTYTMQFYKKAPKVTLKAMAKYTREELCERSKDKLIKEYKDVYCDMLRSLFETTTKLRTSLTNIYAL